MERRGKCVVCGRAGAGTVDFICRDCGDPSGIKFHCRRCRNHIDLTRQDLAELGNIFGREINVGNVIISSACPNCVDGFMSAVVVIYNVRPPVKEAS